MVVDILVVGECDECVFYGIWWLFGCIVILKVGKVFVDVELELYDIVFGLLWVDVYGGFF